jgi:hypothetical protein
MARTASGSDELDLAQQDVAPSIISDFEFAILKSLVHD